MPKKKSTRHLRKELSDPRVLQHGDERRENGVFVDKGLRIHRLRQSGEIDEVAPPCLWTRGFIFLPDIDLGALEKRKIAAETARNYFNVYGHEF